MWHTLQVLLNLNLQVLINVSRETKHGCICNDVPARSQGMQLQITTDHVSHVHTLPCNALHHWPLQALPSVDVGTCRLVQQVCKFTQHISAQILNLTATPLRSVKRWGS